MPAFSLPAAPRRLTHPLHAAGTLSYRVQNPQACTPIASEASLSPVELSAPEHLTSELLRTLSRMAASKPTSCFPLAYEFYPPHTDSRDKCNGLRSLPEVGNLVGPLIQTVLYSHNTITRGY